LVPRIGAGHVKETLFLDPASGKARGRAPPHGQSQPFKDPDISPCT
jgi:hypothetical protein